MTLLATYRTPTFNVLANVWHGLLPPLLTTGFNPDLLPPPHVVIPAQLYVSRYGCGGFFHLVPESIRKTLERAGYAQLRCPKGSDVRAPWMPSSSTTWSDLDIIECPAGSKRYYVAIMVELAHVGFPNEYKVAILSQLADLSGVVGGGIGLAMEMGAIPGGLMAPELPLGLAMEMGAIPGGLMAPELPLGLAMAMEALVGFDRDLPGGLAMAMVAVPGSPMELELPVGLAMEMKAIPGGPMELELPVGLVMTMGAVFGAGSTPPGASCAAAPSISLPFTSSETLPASASHWWKFAATSGVTYHVRISALTGTTPSVTIWSGACGSLSSVDSVGLPFVFCADFVSPVTGDLKIQVLSGGLGSCNYTIEVATGVC